MAEKNKPAKKFWIGSVSVTIWKTVGRGKLPLYSVEFGRMYKDGEESKDSKYFSHDDLLNIAKLAERAEQFIAQDKDSIKALEKFIEEKEISGKKENPRVQ